MLFLNTYNYEMKNREDETMLKTNTCIFRTYHGTTNFGI